MAKLVTVATPWAMTKAMVSFTAPSKPRAISGSLSTQYRKFWTAKVEAYKMPTVAAVLDGASFVDG